MADDVEEQDLPGIGHRYDLEAEGGRISVVIHHGGRRDVYVTEDTRRARPTVVSLSDDQARRFGAVLAGAFFRPAVAERIEALVGGLLIDWVTVPQGSPVRGRSIADLQVRRDTGMTIVAVLRGEDVIVTPEPSEVLEAADRLVVVGRPEDLDRFLRLLAG